MTWFCQGWSQKLAEDSAGIWGLVNALVGDHFGYSDPSCFRVARFLFGFSWFSGGKMCCQLCRQPKARLFGMVLWVWKPGIWQWPLLGLRFIDDGVTFTPRYRWWQCHLWGLHKPCDHEDLKKRSCLESMLQGGWQLVLLLVFMWSNLFARIHAHEQGQDLSREEIVSLLLQFFQPQASPASSYGALMPAASGHGDVV